METKLKRIFDYQRFSPNPRLERMIENTDRTFGRLDDQELLMVSAAGTADLPIRTNPDDGSEHL